MNDLRDIDVIQQDAPPEGPGIAWFHVVVTTYGTWLDGDARGFRTRHHREHVEGDYKNPPPRGRYAARRRKSREALKQPPVFLDDPSLRRLVGRALVARFQDLGAFVLCAAVDQTHAHLQVKMPWKTRRTWRGLAKKHAYHAAHDHGHVGHLWAGGGRELPIADRDHQVNVYHYILRHHNHGAWAWRWKRPVVQRATTGLAPGVATPGLGGTR